MLNHFHVFHRMNLVVVYNKTTQNLYMKSIVLNLIIWYHLPHLNSNNIARCVLKYREINYPPRFFIAAFIFTTLSVKISSTLILCRSFQVDKCLYKSMANVLSKLYVNRINFFQRNSLLDDVCNYVRCMRDESNYLIMRCWRKFLVCVYYEEVYKHWI